MALSCIIAEMKREISLKSRFFIPPVFDAPVKGSNRNIAITFGMEKVEYGVVTRW